MPDRRWFLDRWGAPVELSLGGGARAKEASEAPARLDWLVDGWLRDPYSERILCEIDRELGGVRPGAPSARELAEYHGELKRRIRRAAEWGRLHVVARHLPTGAGERREPPPPPKPAQEQQRGLSILVRTMTGDPVEDEHGFTLVRPDGSEVKAKLSGGEFREASSPEGTHELKFSFLRNARWSAASIRCGEEVGLSVEASGFGDGQEVVFRIRGQWQALDTPPIAELRAPVKGGTASASWRHQQQPGRPAGGEYVVEASVGWKAAWSEPLVVEPHGCSQLEGVKERLVQLGYDSGPPGPESTPQLRSALEDFQRRSGWSEPSGSADAATIEALEELA